MKVLLISHTCQSRTEGQPKLHALSKLPGIELSVVVPNRWKHYGSWREADEPGDAGFQFRVERVRWPWAGPAQFYMHWYPRLSGILREFRPDVIDLWEEPWGLVSAHACWLRNRILPAAKIVSETEQNINKKLPFPFERFRSYVLRNTDYAVGRSAEAVAHLRGKGFEGPTEAVPNAVDAELFCPLNREKCRAEWGVEGFVVGYVGRLVEEKGIDDLLAAISMCGPRVRLVVAGGAPAGVDWAMRSRDLGIGNRVRFLGNCAPGDLPRVMNAMNVLVLPSRTTKRWKEQFGRVVIEAHACGIPVIGSNSGAIPDVVGRGGLIVPEQDPSALAKAIMQLAADEASAAAMGAIGRQQVLQHCTWARVAERMRDIYCKVYSSSRSKDRRKTAPASACVEVGAGRLVE